jgi:hypothetical protein
VLLKLIIKCEEDIVIGKYNYVLYLLARRPEEDGRVDETWNGLGHELVGRSRCKHGKLLNILFSLKNTNSEIKKEWSLKPVVPNLLAPPIAPPPPPPPYTNVPK